MSRNNHRGRVCTLIKMSWIAGHCENDLLTSKYLNNFAVGFCLDLTPGIWSRSFFQENSLGFRHCFVSMVAKSVTFACSALFVGCSAMQADSSVLDSISSADWRLVRRSASTVAADKDGYSDSTQGEYVLTSTAASTYCLFYYRAQSASSSNGRQSSAVLESVFVATWPNCLVSPGQKWR